VGQAAEGLKNTAFALFVLSFYNQVHGVPGTLCGLALGVALLFDAITDPLAGSLSDNWSGRLTRERHEEILNVLAQRPPRGG
jgi:Na+/melibiose symporter-like transporter